LVYGRDGREGSILGMYGALKLLKSGIMEDQIYLQ
jgi:hypothetical protein